MTFSGLYIERSDHKYPSIHIMENIKVIGFDADDTLWVNEPFFRDSEEQFCDLLEGYMPRHDIMKLLFSVEIKNLDLYGYGIKAFVLSMIEAAMEITGGTVNPQTIQKILQIGRNQLLMPVENLPGVEETILHLKKTYKLVVVTKGDLLDQERKLEKSGLLPYFHHIEIVSEKKESEYHKLLRHLDITPDEFLMVGNSLKSDILPILAIGGWGFHIPFHTTWAHEHVEITIKNEKFRELESIHELIGILP
jgi:putative hydrolase of the HAD superfamily